MNKTLKQLLDLEAELLKLGKASSVTATIKADDLKEIELAASDLKLHLYEPFEVSPNINTYHFNYRIPNTEHNIIVKHTEEYRISKKLVAI